MAADYIPRSDSAFDAFQANLISKVAPKLAVWNIPAAAFDKLKDLHQAWQSAFSVASTPKGNNPVDNKKKDAARAAYEKALRQFVNQYLRYNTAIKKGDRVDMGLKIRDKKRTDVPVPASQPQAQKIDKDTEARHIIHFRDKDNPNSKAKPFGVHHIEIRYRVGGDKPAAAEDCLKVVTDTETPVTIKFKQEDAGKRVYYFLRWVNNTSKPGPWTAVRSAIIT